MTCDPRTAPEPSEIGLFSDMMKYESLKDAKACQDCPVDIGDLHGIADETRV